MTIPRWNEFTKCSNDEAGGRRPALSLHRQRFVARRYSGSGEREGERRDAALKIDAWSRVDTTYCYNFFIEMFQQCRILQRGEQQSAVTSREKAGEVISSPSRWHVVAAVGKSTQ